MSEISFYILITVLGGTAVIAEVLWHHFRRKALRRSFTSREKRKTIAKYRRFHLWLIFGYTFLTCALVFTGKNVEFDQSEPDLQHDLLNMDSTEVDEFLEQYKEELRSQEIED